MRSPSRTLPLRLAARVTLAAVLTLLIFQPMAAAPASDALAWQSETVYARGGRATALSVQGDNVHLAFVDETEAKVRYARLGRAGWDWEVVALAGPHRADALFSPSVRLDIAAPWRLASMPLPC